MLCYIVTQSIRYSLPQQELVDGLLFPHALHDQTVQVDEQSAAKTTSDSTDKDKDAVCLLKVELEHPGESRAGIPDTHWK